MLHFTFDQVTVDVDYLIEKSFTKIYTAQMELVVSYPMQVMLSQKRPPHEIRYDDKLEEQGVEKYYIPETTYAYTT